MAAYLSIVFLVVRSRRFWEQLAWTSMRYFLTSRSRTTFQDFAVRSLQPTCSRRWRTRRSTSRTWRQRWRSVQTGTR
jgi:hypothetical protein